MFAALFTSMWDDTNARRCAKTSWDCQKLKVFVVIKQDNSSRQPYGHVQWVKPSRRWLPVMTWLWHAIVAHISHTLAGLSALRMRGKCSMALLVKGYTNMQCTHIHDACVCVCDGCILINIEWIFEMWLWEMIYYMGNPGSMKMNL